MSLDMMEDVTGGKRKKKVFDLDEKVAFGVSAFTGRIVDPILYIAYSM